MTDKTIYISESNLEKGSYDETGAKVITNQYVRTKNKINNDIAFLRGVLDFQALRNKTITGSFDGTTDWTYNAKSCDQLDGYTANANYKIEYYWVYSFKDDASTGQTRRFFVGSFFIRTPKIGGNKQDEPPYFSSRMCRQSSSWADAVRGTYIFDIDLAGLTISYYDSGQSGTITTMSLVEYVQPWFTEDETEYSFTVESRGERDSEFVDTKVALLGYRRSSLVYSDRWEESNGTYLDFLQDAPIDHFHMVFEIPEVTNPAVDEIIQPNIRLETDAWYLNRDDELDNTDLPESTGDENFVYPYPATLWYYDKRLRQLNMMLIPLPLSYGEFSDSRPDQISIYDINEPQDGFNHNGLAILMPIECISNKEELGRWDLTLTHPIDDYGKWTYIIIQNVLKVNGQLFRIDETEIYEDAEQAYITAHAKHITYDLFDRFVDEVTVENVSGGTYIGAVINRSQEILPTHQPEPNEYTFDVTSNITGPVTTKVQDQTVIGAIFGDDNSLATRYGGQLYRNNFHMSVNTTQEGAPTSPAFKLRFGTDLTKLSYKIDCSEWITELICKDNFGDVWAISYTGSTWIIHHQKTRVMHFTYDPNTPDPYDCLTKDGFAYWQTVSTPTVSIEVSIANLKNDPKYKDFIDLQNLDVGYEGNVYIEQYGIDVNLKIVSIRRDELTGEALQVVLGTSRGSFIRSPVMSQTIVANGTVLGKQEAEMQAMKDQMDDMTLKQMHFWRGMSSYKWTDAQNYTWREILNGHKDNTL